MNRIKSLFFLFFALLVTFVSSFADTDPVTLLRTADSEIFIKAGFSQNYDEKQGYTNEFVSGDILHQYFISNGKGSEVLTSLQPSPVSVNVTNKRVKFDDRRAKVFHVSYKLQRTESIPDNAGYCFFRYSDAVIAGAGRESGVIVYPGYKAFAYSPVDGVMQYSEIADLSGLDIDRNIKADVIRIDGIAYFYFNGSFAFQYEDGIANPVSFEGGTELLEGSNRIRCDFDDFTFLSQ